MTVIGCAPRPFPRAETSKIVGWLDNALATNNNRYRREGGLRPAPRQRVVFAQAIAAAFLK
jgi:hypothetical protein